MRFRTRFSYAAILWCTATLAVSPAQAITAFVQASAKLVGTGPSGQAGQGQSVALSADGSTLIVGGELSSFHQGGAWVFTRNPDNSWTQQGGELLGTGASGNPEQGSSVALSADGNTAAIGGPGDNGNIGAVWIFTRSGSTWTQQGGKLVGTGAVGTSVQGNGVALSADGNTLLVGGWGDNNLVGAAWVFRRSGGVWTQDGNKIVGVAAIGAANVGFSAALSADGNTAALGGPSDHNGQGAVFVFKFANGSWTQDDKLVGVGSAAGSNVGSSVSLSADGNTLLFGGPGQNAGAGIAWVFLRDTNGNWNPQTNGLVGSNAIGAATQGVAVALAGDGNTAIVGGSNDNSGAGAVWVYTRTGGTLWIENSKLTGTGATGAARQGTSAAISSNATTFATGGANDSTDIGATWLFARPSLAVSPSSDISAVGNVGGPFMAPSFDYTLGTPVGTVNYTITGVPAWLNVTSTSGSLTTAPTPLTFTVNGNANAMAVGTYGPTTITIANTTNGFGSRTIAATLTVAPDGTLSVVSAVLPASRSVQVGAVATAFATIINTGGGTGTNCGLSLGGTIPAAFHFQTTDPATNALTGTLNVPVNIAAGGAQSYVFAIAPSAAFAPTDVPITAGCSNGTPATSVVGLNTFLLSASATPVPDIVALAATAGNDGIVNVAGANGAGAFAVATVNVGIAADITASADTGAASLPVAISLCQTNPATSQCTSATGPTVTTTIAANATPTFAIFVQGSGSVPFDPAHNRIFVRFKDTGGVVRGATSVAVRTQ